MKTLISKNGAVSKTAIMLWIAYVFIMIKFALSGMTIGMMTFPAFDSASALVIWGMASGTYIASNSALTK